MANALVSLQETTEFMAKTVNVMIDSVKMQMVMSVGVCVHLISHNIAEFSSTTELNLDCI